MRTLVLIGIGALALIGLVLFFLPQSEKKSAPIISVQEAQYTSQCDASFVPARYEMARAIEELQLDGGALLIIWKGKAACEAYFGNYDESTAVPVVSAAKWLSAVAILKLVDDKILALDDPVSKYLPYFVNEKSQITLRQLLSHTSGLPDYSECMFKPELTLDECAQEIAKLELLAAPGKELNYGGTAFTVAGRMAEVASQQPWNEIFKTRIATPLELTKTFYGNTQNPMLSEGYTSSSLRDYGTFLQMLYNKGISHGQRILSESAIAEMQKDQTLGAEIGFSPRGQIRYGLGMWRDRVGPQGEPIAITSPGGGGFMPWIDYGRELIGIIMVYDRIERVWGKERAVMQKIREVIDHQSTP
jgi:CubicO group peptidase (beta-lactamase class C family)